LEKELKRRPDEFIRGNLTAAKGSGETRRNREAVLYGA
jgi:hypothetical protein